MEKKLITICTLSIVTLLFFSGCIGSEQKALTKGEEEGKITLESDVVELADSSFVENERWDSNQKKNVLKNIEVKYLLHNLLEKRIEVEINAEFYDKDDNLIAIGGPEHISLAKEYTERAYTPQNSIMYDGSKMDEVHHAVIIVNQIK